MSMYCVCLGILSSCKYTNSIVVIQYKSKISHGRLDIHRKTSRLDVRHMDIYPKAPGRKCALGDKEHKYMRLSVITPAYLDTWRDIPTGSYPSVS